MNLLHMKYAVVVAQSKSINQAAEKLLVGAPALSRAIKELEVSLGVTLFERHSRGMILTPDGEVFVRYASRVLEQVDEMEQVFRNETVTRMSFTASVPRASYIGCAFAKFTNRIGKDIKADIYYHETSSMRSIRNMTQNDYKLGILRYASLYDKYYQQLLEEKEFCSRKIIEFKYVLVMNKNNPLNQKENITFEDLKDYIEIAHADPYVPFLPFSVVKKEELPDNSMRRIFICERASQLEMLAKNPETFMWVSPTPKTLQDRYGIVDRECAENDRTYKDILVYPKNYELTSLDKMFIEELMKVKETMFGGDHPEDGKR